MRRALLFPAAVLLAVLFVQEARAQSESTDRVTDGAGAASGLEDPWLSTFSIIVYDPETNEHGVAVQSRAFGAGAAVPFAKGGVGAVATQAAANRQYGPMAIELLEDGLSPEEVLERITEDDRHRDRRQVAVMDAQGRSAVYTGKTVATRGDDPEALYRSWAGHASRSNISAQGNTLAGEEVVRAMVGAYEQGGGGMAERLMDALEAAQEVGGDVRGMQSAGILVVRPVTSYPDDTVERVVDVRVDDGIDPYRELRRVLNVQLSRRHTRNSAELAEEGRHEEALDEQKLVVDMNPNHEQSHYVLAQRYARVGEYLNALRSLEAAFAIQPLLADRAAEDEAFVPMREMVEFTRLVGP